MQNDKVMQLSRKDWSSFNKNKYNIWKI